MSGDRQRRWADLIHYLAATVLMVLALMNVDGWLPVAGVLAAYFTVCFTEGILNGHLQFYILADRSES